MITNNNSDYKHGSDLIQKLINTLSLERGFSENTKKAYKNEPFITINYIEFLIKA